MFFSKKNIDINKEFTLKKNISFLFTVLIGYLAESFTEQLINKVDIYRNNISTVLFKMC